MITFGHLAQKPRAGWVLLIVMIVLFAGGLALCDWAESAAPPQLAGLNVTGGNMEWKEVRFGIGASVLNAIVNSNTSTGSYNSVFDSYQSLGVLGPLVFLLLGEVVLDGWERAFYRVEMVALLGVFFRRADGGRTPEYLGKKIRSPKTGWIALYTAAYPESGAGSVRSRGRNAGRSSP
jgi:potassium-transporting ATPase potassium-binding subunit